MTDALPARAIEWVRTAVPGARDVYVRGTLPGATTSSLHVLEVTRDGVPALLLVLRRYTDARVRSEEPQYPHTEATALHSLEGAPGFVAPRPIAVDAVGASCDVPAVLMTRLDGHPTLAPPDVDGWVRGLAEALAAVHRLDGAGLDRMFTRWHNPTALRPPRWSRQSAAWARLIEASRTLEPTGPAVLLHRDYHPGNVLWQDGHVSGIVDWPNACRGPAGIDVGHCRRDLVTTHGTATAAAFLAAYEKASGRAPDTLCDALTLLDHGEDDTDSVRTYHALGCTNLTVDLMHTRLDEYAALIAGRL